MDENRPMRRLKVDLPELIMALDNSSWEAEYYLDLETGQVIMVTGEIHTELEALYETYYEKDPESFPVAEIVEAIKQLDGPDWWREAILEAHQIEMGHGTRYISIPKTGTPTAYRDMQHFIATVQDDRLKERLWQAIQGRGAFRCFRDVLARHPDEQDRWYDFGDACQRQRALEWLESEGIELIED